MAVDNTLKFSVGQNVVIGINNDYLRNCRENLLTYAIYDALVVKGSLLMDIFGIL